MPLPAGTQLGPYDIQGVIGSGGMGEVYRAHDTRLDRLVAIKILSGNLLESPHTLERFEREAKAIAALNHPNICTLHDIGKHEGSTFLVMELLEGETLQRRLSRGMLPVAQVVDLSIALSEALAAAHEKGIIHRDIKPANIFLTPHGPKILDFGLAKSLAGPSEQTASNLPTREVQEELTDAGYAVGTLAYMSPEQLRGEPLDGRTDVFSLGVVLYQMATGQAPFAGPTSAVVSAAILHATPRSPRVLRPDLPSQLEATILKMIEKDRDERCQTASELRADLRRFKREVHTVSGEATGVSSPAVPIVPAKAKPRALARTATVLLAALAIAVGIYGWIQWREKDAARSIVEPSTPAQFQVERLTTTESAFRPAISPDGKFVAYVEQRGAESSLWIRQIEPDSKSEIVAPEPGVRILGATITPDGSFVDYVKSTVEKEELWRIPFLGRVVPRKILDDVGSLVAWSPDGRNLAFIRTVQGGGTTLVVADSNGGGERVLAKRSAPGSFRHFRSLGANLRRPFVPAWSPDGRTIAVIGVAEGQGQVVFVNVSSGKEQSVTVQPGAGTNSLAWLDDTALVLSRAERPGPPTQLWRLSYPGGELTRITNDSTNYEGVSLTADRRTLVTARVEWRVGIFVADDVETEWTEVIPPEMAAPIGWGLTWSGEALLYPRTASGPPSISRFVPGQKTLPEEIIPSAANPQVTGDGRSIVFQGGGSSVVDIDGRNQRALSSIIGPYTVTGRDVVFAAGGLIQMVSLDGGPVRNISDLPADATTRPVVSPDRKRIFFGTLDPKGGVAGVVCDLATCKTRQTLPILLLPRWMPDGSGIAYVDQVTRSNLWVYPMDGRPPRQLTTFKDGLTIADFAWSPDGKRLALGRARDVNDIVLFRDLEH